MSRIASRLSIRLKLLIVFTLLFTVAFTLSFLWFFQFATKLALDNLRRDLIGTAVSAASVIDPEQHTTVYEFGEADDENYTAIAIQLRQVRDANPKVDSIYTMVRSPDDPQNELLFVVSALEDLDERADLREPYDVTDQQQMIAAFEEPTADPEIVVDRWGAWFSGYAPILDENGEAVGIVGVDMIAQEVIDVQNLVRDTSVGAFVLVYAALFISIFFVSFTITRPLRQIINAAYALERGDRFHPEQLASVAEGTDELGQLARTFSEMAVQVQAREEKLKQEVAQLKIEIDRTKQDRQVAEITETDFFQNLRQKASYMRQRSAGASSRDS